MSRTWASCVEESGSGFVLGRGEVLGDGRDWGREVIGFVDGGLLLLMFCRIEEEGFWRLL